MIIVLWFDLVSSVLLFKITSTTGIHFLWKLQKLITIENTLQYSPIFFSLLLDSDSLNHKFFTNLWNIMKNNFHFGICDKQQSPQDSLALMVATADKYLSRTQSYRLHRYDLSNAWKEYNLQQLVGPMEEYFISYNCFFSSVNEHLQSENSHVKLMVYIHRYMYLVLVAR